MAQLPPEALAELMALFRGEARDHLDALSQAVVALEQASVEEVQGLVEAAARRAHNVKGAASTLGLEEVSRVTHAFEQALLALPEAPLARDGADALLQALDWLEAAVSGEPPEAGAVLTTLEAVSGAPAGAVAASGPAEASTAGARPRPEPDALHADHVRVPVALLEQVLAPLAGLVPLQAGELRDAEALQLAREALDQETRHLARVGTPDARASARRLREVGQRLERAARELRGRARQGALAVADLEEAIGRARMVPVSTLEGLLLRSVRDAAQRAGKQAAFVLEGGQVGLDRGTLERLREPLVHLVRNAVAHGIEAPADRAARGRPETGQVWLRAAHEGDSIALEVADDGAGIDLDAARARAVSQGLLHPDAAADADPDALVGLLFRPGFSTAPALTELAGRGIGLDAVRSVAEACGGAVTVASDPGEGTRFRITVPLKLVSTRVLLIRAGGQTFGIPAAAVERVGRLATATPFELDGARWVQADARPARLVPLVRGGGDAAPGYFVVASGGGHRQALEVDAIAGEEDLVVEPLGPPLHRVRGTLGTALLHGDEVVVILDPAELGEPVGTSTPARTEAPARRLRILVVDDSITTRTLESHVLESAGFEVRVACDGREALEVLRSEPVDAVLADVEMPRLDGVGLAQAIRGDAALAHLPVVLMTSLGSEEDQHRGLTAGANAYLVKSRFDQEELVATLHRLVG